jgi:hypothetical protein
MHIKVTKAVLTNVIHIFFIFSGKKRLRNPGINVEDCLNNRYQPFKITTYGNSDCVFLKSFCEEEGQVIVNNGTSSTDRSCRCDYTRGYVYVTPPSDICSCVPSSEDCSCYLKPCANDEKMTAGKN